MKKLILGVMACVALLAVSVVAQTAKSYTGEIMDSACAAAGSHAAMLKPGESAKTCTDGCVKMGAKYVLYDAKTKAVYQLDDQKKPMAFSGDKVTVMGTLDPATKTITVASIKKAA